MRTYKEQTELILEKVAERNEMKKKRVKKIYSISATVAALVLITGLFNFQAVLAFIRGLPFFPGIGFTESNLSVVVLKEPIHIETESGIITLEFATKLKHDDGKCEILFNWTTRDQHFFDGYSFDGGSDSSIIKATAIINDEIYDFSFDWLGAGYDPAYGWRGNSYSMNKDFPDINEFDLHFTDTTARIVLTELTEEEKIPYMSKKINGITLVVYKFRGTNRIISIDIINNNDLSSFYTATPEIHFEYVTGKNNTMLPFIGNIEHSFRGWAANDPERAFGYYLMQLHNEENIELIALDLPFVIVEYYSNVIPNYTDVRLNTTDMKFTLPIPKDGETINTDIKIPVGGIYYEISEVRREGDTIYYKDNAIMYDETFDFESAMTNGGVYIGEIRSYPNHVISVYNDRDIITGFNPDDDFLDVYLRNIQVIYIGDYSVDLTQKPK